MFMRWGFPLRDTSNALRVPNPHLHRLKNLHLLSLHLLPGRAWVSSYLSHQQSRYPAYHSFIFPPATTWSFHKSHLPLPIPFSILWFPFPPLNSLNWLNLFYAFSPDESSWPKMWTVHLPSRWPAGFLQQLSVFCCWFQHLHPFVPWFLM